MSPAPRKVYIFSAVELRVGARHGTDEDSGSGAARSLLVSGAFESEVEGERGLLDPVFAETTSIATSTSISVWEVCSSPIIFQGAVGSLRATILTPGVPAYRFRVCIPDTQDPQMNESYSAPWIRGGGSPEEDASESASSFSFDSSVSAGAGSGGQA